MWSSSFSNWSELDTRAPFISLIPLFILSMTLNMECVLCNVYCVVILQPRGQYFAILRLHSVKNPTTDTCCTSLDLLAFGHTILHISYMTWQSSVTESTLNLFSNCFILTLDFDWPENNTIVCLVCQRKYFFTLF